MLFEVQVRMLSPLTQEQEDEVRAAKITNYDFDEYEFLKDKKSYYYLPLTIDLYDVRMFRMSDEDEDHTLLFCENDSFLIKMNYYVFQGLYETTMGVKVKTVDDYQLKFKNVKK